MAKLGPDLYTGSDSYSGYQPTGVFTGFSMLHESGTGGAPKYGVVSQMPVVGSVHNPLADHTDSRAADDEARVGYYKASLGSGITVELAATARAGIYNYTFSPSSGTSSIIVDVSHALPSYRGMGLGQHYLGGNIAIISSQNGAIRYEGAGSYDNVSSSILSPIFCPRTTSLHIKAILLTDGIQGWNRSPRWTVFFCGAFSAPNASFMTFVGKDAGGTVLDQYSDAATANSTARVGAVFAFGQATSVISRVGVSFISARQACSNLDSQIPAGTSLSAVTSSTREAWNTQILSKVTTTSADTADLQLLYTSLYHMNLLPTNKTGENPLWSSSEPYYDDTFTLWDLVSSAATEDALVGNFRAGRGSWG